MRNLKILNAGRKVFSDVPDSVYHPERMPTQPKTSVFRQPYEMLRFLETQSLCVLEIGKVQIAFWSKTRDSHKSQASVVLNPTPVDRPHSVIVPFLFLPENRWLLSWCVLLVV
jgi:hypothetical protein